MKIEAKIFLKNSLFFQNKDYICITNLIIKRGKQLYNGLKTNHEHKKITLATLKSFVKKNEGNLFINVESSFNGMIDGVECLHDGFLPAEKAERNIENTLGINGAWCVGSSRDYFTPFSNEAFEGIEVNNSCGSFILAIKK